MKLGTNCALLVIDIQQEDFRNMTPDNLADPAWDCIRSARRVLNVFRAEGPHCLEDSPGTDFA